MMNDRRKNEGYVAGYRPSFAIYHPNAKGTGCAIRMNLVPAHGREDGCIMLEMANQKTIGNRQATVPSFPTFDWEGKICVKLDFTSLCKFLQVFRGECESINDGAGLYHRSAKYSTKIMFSHLLEPSIGYALEVYRSVKGEEGGDKRSRIFLNQSEALGVSIAIEGSIGTICFGASSQMGWGNSAAAEMEDREAIANEG